MEKDGPLDALALWFDCTFNPLHDLENPVSRENFSSFSLPPNNSSTT